MLFAYNCTRREVHYRHEIFSAGLKAAGYQVRSCVPDNLVKPGDVLLIWNRYGQYHDIATRFERAGGTVIVAENGYLRGPKDGGDYYALARHGHNGSGTWPDAGEDRFAALGVELKDWRTDGEHILVCPNRSFGMPGMIMPCDWPRYMRDRLAKFTRREIRIRTHPGNDAPKKPLADDLKDAWAVVIWASSAGVHALVAGIPVICESPYWICKSAAGTLNRIEDPTMFGRTAALEKLAWAQWSLAEIESGVAFDHLLRTA
jgi:hypothetical protein